MTSRRLRIVASTVALSVPAALGALAAVVPPNPAAAGAPMHSSYDNTTTAVHIGVIGDSVATAIPLIGAWAPLRRYDYTFDSATCRRLVVGSCSSVPPPTALQTMRMYRGQWGHVLVMTAGYNDVGSSFASAVDAIMAEAFAQGIHKVVWLTFRTGPVYCPAPGWSPGGTSFRNNNLTLLQRAPRYGGRLVIADWASYSAGFGRDLVARDGVHFSSAAGALAYSQFIANSVTQVLAGDDITPACARPQPSPADRAPSGLGVSVAPAAGVGSNQALLTWGLPVFTGDRVVTDYAVQYSLDGTAWTTFADGLTNRRWTLVTGLTNGAAYRFRVAAYTSAGWGPFSAAVAAIPRVALPGAPTVAAAAAPALGVGSNQVLLSWSQPFAGGRTITDYTVQVSTDGTTWSTFADGTTRRRWTLVGGLTNGVTYRFRVAAYTSAGWGPFSAAVTSIPRVALPGAPTVAAAAAPALGVGSNQILLSWPQPFAGGRTITDYTVQVSTDGTAWSTFADGTTRRRWTLVGGLTNGVTYRFRVAAYTSAGTGPTSVPVAATPSAPAALLASPPPTVAAAGADSTVATTPPDTVDTVDTTYTGGVETTSTTTSSEPPDTTTEGAWVEGLVWIDTDGDGRQGAGEAGRVDHVTVRLLDDAGVALAEVTTGPDGAFVFGPHPPGRYRIEADLPAGWVLAPADQGPDDLDADFLPVDLDPDLVRTDVLTLAPGVRDDVALGLVAADPTASPAATASPASTTTVAPEPETTTTEVAATTTSPATTQPTSTTTSTTTSVAPTSTPPPETAAAEPTPP